MKKLKKGFTLIELMVVMAIIAVLATLIIGAISVARKASIETTHRGYEKTVQTGLESYFAKNKAYPQTTGNYSFNAVATATGVSQAGLTSGTVECSGKKLTADNSISTDGGGYVTYSTNGYTLVPVDNTCLVALPSTDQITVP